MIKLLLKAGTAGLVAYGVVAAFKHFKVAEKATVLADELLTRVVTGPKKEPSA